MASSFTNSYLWLVARKLEDLIEQDIPAILSWHPHSCSVASNAFTLLMMSPIKITHSMLIAENPDSVGDMSLGEIACFQTVRLS